MLATPTPALTLNMEQPMSKAAHKSIQNRGPVTLSVAEIASLADRLSARAQSAMLDQPEQRSDLDLAARLIRHIVRAGLVRTSVAIE